MLNHLKRKVYLINNKEYYTESISSLFGQITVGNLNKISIIKFVKNQFINKEMNFIFIRNYMDYNTLWNIF